MSMRLLFGLIGALCCLAAALLSEALFSLTGLGQTLDDRLAHVMIFRSDIARRLDLAGGKSGDVQITLAWNNHNDLDLWCFDPKGHKIFYSVPSSPTGGVLDVDANGGGPKTATPIENIYWPYGRAPVGRYKVQVDYFANHNDPDPTAYRCQVIAHGRVRTFTGVLRPHETRTITEFNLTPSMAGWGGDRLFAFLRALLLTAAWTSLIGLLLGLGLIGGLQVIYLRHYRQPLVTLRQFWEILLFGLFAGAIGGVMGQTLYNLLETVPWLIPEWVARGLGWCLLGLMMGKLTALHMPHLPRRSASWAGLVGGALGAWSYLSTLGSGSDGVGRLAAAGLLGLLIGLMIVLVLEYAEEPAEMEWFESGVTRMRLRPLRMRRQKVSAPGGIGPSRRPPSRTPSR